MDEIETKYCGGCKKTKPVTEFNRNRSSKDGFARRCKACRRIDDRAYYMRRKVSSVKGKPGPKTANEADKDCNRWYSGPEVLEQRIREMSKSRLVSVYMCDGKDPIIIRI